MGSGQYVDKSTQLKCIMHNYWLTQSKQIQCIILTLDHFWCIVCTLIVQNAHFIFTTLNLLTGCYILINH